MHVALERLSVAFRWGHHILQAHARWKRALLGQTHSQTALVWWWLGQAAMTGVTVDLAPGNVLVHLVRLLDQLNPLT